MKICIIHRWRNVSILLLVLTALGGCTHLHRQQAAQARWMSDEDRTPAAEPAPAAPFLYPQDGPSDIGREFEALLELSARTSEWPQFAILGGKSEALNTNAFDEAPDSTWFTNRIGRTPHRPPKELFHHATPAHPPIIDRHATIQALGHTDAADWIALEDHDGARVILTFDRRDRPELQTGAGIIASRLLSAAGYRVPTSTLIDIDPAQFSLAADALYQEASGEQRTALPSDATSIIEGIARKKGSTGLARALATIEPEGIHLGPFSYAGKRRRDANDRIPHEHRRELRGLRLFSAWLDHRFAVDAHTADFFYDTGDNRGFVDHYIFGFEESLGNAARKSPAPLSLHPESTLTPTVLGLSSSTLYSKEAAHTTLTWDPFDADHLNPERWDTHLPNDAFHNMTARDALWAASILLHFTETIIAAAVDEAHFSDATHRNRILRALLERRQRLISYGLSKLAPLGNFTVAMSPQGIVLAFDDLAVAAGIAKDTERNYRFRIKTRNSEKILQDWQSLRGTRETLDTAAFRHTASGRSVIVELQVKNAADTWWLPAVDVILQKEAEQQFRFIGIDRHRK